MSSINGKPEDNFIENVSIQPKEVDEFVEDYSDVDEAKVIRKIDWHLMPVICILYVLCYMDRSNIGNAKIEGLQEDLKLTSNQYDLCLMVFFISYSACEVPSNMILKKIGKQSLFIPTIMVLWGIVMTCMGLVKNYAGFISLRFLLGLFESGFYPGISFGLTMYYKKSDMLSRQAIFYSGSSLAGAFSGLLAFGIGKMDGVGGYRGWRWIFILEGLLTLVFAVACFWILIDYPSDCKFLTEREKEFVVWRLKNDANHIERDQSLDRRFEKSTRAIPDLTIFDEKDDITMKQALIRAFTDWQVIVQIVIYWGINIPGYALAFYIPSVLKSLGYTSSIAQLMSCPVYVCAAILSISQAFMSDYVGYRFPFAVFNVALAHAGIGLIISGNKSGDAHMQYAGIFLIASGLVSAFPNFIAWHANNLANSRKRAIGMAAQIGIGNFGAAASSQVYKNGNYLRGHYIVLGFIALAMVGCWVLVVAYWHINKKDITDLENGKYDEYTDRDFYRLGDKSPFYTYSV